MQHLKWYCASKAPPLLYHLISLSLSLFSFFLACAISSIVEFYHPRFDTTTTASTTPLTTVSFASRMTCGEWGWRKEGSSSEQTWWARMENQLKPPSLPIFCLVGGEFLHYFGGPDLLFCIVSFILLHFSPHPNKENFSLSFLFLSLPSPSFQNPLNQT